MGFWPALRKIKRNNSQYTVAFGGRGNRRRERPKRERRRDHHRGGALGCGKLEDLAIASSLSRVSGMQAETRADTSTMRADVELERMPSGCGALLRRQP